MAENFDKRRPTHRVYSVIRGSQGDSLVDIGHASLGDNGPGYDILLHAMPEDGELLCREIATTKTNRDTYAASSVETPEQDTIAAAQ